MWWYATCLCDRLWLGLHRPHILPSTLSYSPVLSVIPGLGAMALGIARTAIETFNEIAGAKTPQRTTQMLLDNHGAQVRVSRRSRWCARPGCFLFDSLDRL